MSTTKQQNFKLPSAAEPINLVLSGGGVKGVAHIALLELLEERGIPIRAISGSSAGALVGALYCSGKRPQEILTFFKSTPIFRYTWLNPTKAGIFDSEKYALVISDFVEKTFEELQIPLTIAATNIEKNEVSYFQGGDLILPLLASCAVPAVFSPVLIGGELYSDGGVMDNFPILPFTKETFPIIGSDVCQPRIKSPKELNSILKVTNHANMLLLYSANSYKYQQTYSTVVYPLGEFNIFDSSKIDQIYNKTKMHLEETIEQ